MNPSSARDQNERNTTWYLVHFAATPQLLPISVLFNYDYRLFKCRLVQLVQRRPPEVPPENGHVVNARGDNAGAVTWHLNHRIQFMGDNWSVCLVGSLYSIGILTVVSGRAFTWSGSGLHAPMFQHMAVQQHESYLEGVLLTARSPVSGVIFAVAKQPRLPIILHSNVCVCARALKRKSNFKNKLLLPARQQMRQGTGIKLSSRWQQSWQIKPSRAEITPFCQMGHFGSLFWSCHHFMLILGWCFLLPLRWNG